jgi:hypothetical protein
MGLSGVPALETESEDADEPYSDELGSGFEGFPCSSTSPGHGTPRADGLDAESRRRSTLAEGSLVVGASVSSSGGGSQA